MNPKFFKPILVDGGNDLSTKLECNFGIGREKLDYGFGQFLGCKFLGCRSKVTW